jgi:hypothetical protein
MGAIMAGRKQITLDAMNWRIERVTLSPEQEAQMRPILEQRPEEAGGRGAVWDKLRRHEDQIICGYKITRGIGAHVEVARVFLWQPLHGISEQDALNSAFNHLKLLNREDMT